MTGKNVVGDGNVSIPEGGTLGEDREDRGTDIKKHKSRCGIYKQPFLTEIFYLQEKAILASITSTCEVPMKARTSILPDRMMGGIVSRPEPETTFTTPGGKHS